MRLEKSGELSAAIALFVMSLRARRSAKGKVVSISPRS